VLREWPTFGLTAARPNATRRPTGVTAGNARRLRRQQVRLPGTVDSSPILVGGRIVVTTTYGRTLAVDPRDGRILWRFTPASIGSWAGTARITNATPTADPSGRFVYAASPDGRVHKLSLADGSEQPGWPVTVTRDPTHEKLTSSLNVSRGRLIVATGGYLGDAPPYQGHVVSIDTASGRITAVFNTLCSDRHTILAPASCPATDSAIWSRSGATVEPGSGRLLVATGNAPSDGRTSWGNSVLELSPDGRRLLHSWTPHNAEQLSATDTDVGSTSPALLPDGLVLQSGKDAVLHLLDLRRLNGTNGAASPRRGGQLQDLPAPGRQPVFTAPAVQGHTVYVASAGGTAAYRVRGRRLAPLWHVPTAGTSPVVAGGLLYVYDPDGGGLRLRRPGSGRVVATLPAGRGHWNSPVVAGGVVVLPQGDANDHATSGTLNLYRLR
jgi:outer membrane protein assembly factor BamB